MIWLSPNPASDRFAVDSPYRCRLTYGLLIFGRTQEEGQAA
jgi:hypothetical protein